NTTADESAPCLTPDGRFFVFASERSDFGGTAPQRVDAPTFERRIRTVLNGRGNVYLSPREALGLPPATALAYAPEMLGEGELSTPDDDGGGQIRKDGRRIYFEKAAPPHYLYLFFESHLVGGKWTTPNVLPWAGRWKDTDPVLTPDEQSVLFASDRPVHG